MHARNGFTLVELLVVSLVIGLLAAIALPKFAANEDKARLAVIKSDVRNAEAAEEAYIGDHPAYASYPDLQAAQYFSASPGDSVVIQTSSSGYYVEVSNSAIAHGTSVCHVDVAFDAISSDDGEIGCP